MELIYFQTKQKNQKFNFIYCYRAPNTNEQNYLDKLDDFIHTLNLDEPLFILGDLNMDVNSNSNIIEFIKNNDVVNFIQKPTRVCSKFYKKINATRHSSTLIDLFLHNGDLVDQTDVINCPFSDHKFVVANLLLKKPKNEHKTIECRNLSTTNIANICSAIEVIDYKPLKNLATIEQKWNYLKEVILKIIDAHAPKRKISLRFKSFFPWYDDELIKLKHLKNSFYKRFKRTDSANDKVLYDHYNRLYKDYNDEKLIEYFKDKSMNDFKNAKKFWEFYSSKISIKSDKSSNNPISHVNFNGRITENKRELCDAFNFFFTSISSTSNVSLDDSARFIENQLFENNQNVKADFKFSFTTTTEIDDLLSTIQTSSGAGICDIPTKVLKIPSVNLKRAIVHLFNYSILTSTIPSDWKTAVVTPLFKKKGSTDDLNNYRSISILPPIAKLFEKLIHKQILAFLDSNNFITNDQHGFRANHSCETALHEIISKINNIKSKRLIGLLLFIDFKKAFDTVDSRLLILKLKFYGFSDSAINLIRNYFENRKQLVKIDGCISDTLGIKLGVPQGSVLGPLLFLIFINDIVRYLNDLEVKLFADDTTIIKTDNDLTTLLAIFHKAIEKLVIWCKFNRIDINWGKTKAMFITNKKQFQTPNSIIIDNNIVEVVSHFKLLGVTIDNKLSFLKHVADLRKSINKRLYSINRLFYLSHRVKLQFFKSFILPHFDYGMSLFIYFPKRALQKLANTYNYTLYRLLNVSYPIRNIEDYNGFHIMLKQFNLECFQHRIIGRISSFIHKIFNLKQSPSNLKSLFIRNYSVKETSIELRNKKHFYVPSKGKFNNFNENTFLYFYSKFINAFLLQDLKLSYSLFCRKVDHSINSMFLKCCNLFPKFDLNYKIF
jgi:hypothetical protein